MFVQKLEEHQSIQCLIWYVFENLFQPVSFGRRHLFLVLSKQFPHYPPLTMFHIFDARFLQKHLLDPMAFCLAVLTRSYLKVARMFDGQTFSPASFLANLFENEGFSEGKCHSVTIVWSIILYLASHYQLADVICNLRSIPLAADIFWFFTKFRPKKILPRINFQLFFFAKF